MINFFRKIRNLPAGKAGKMADNNPPAGRAGQYLQPAWPAGRYMRDAIGEIVLVVIGILISLQINNWNEERKESVQENQLLKELSLNLQSNIEEFKKNIDFENGYFSIVQIFKVSLNRLSQTTILVSKYKNNVLNKSHFFINFRKIKPEI